MLRRLLGAVVDGVGLTAGSASVREAAKKVEGALREPTEEEQP